MTVKIVKAKKVRGGDFIPGLDNAYVPWEPERIDTYSVVDSVRILMHDQWGNEFTLECHKDMPITIERRDGQ